jgi:hypothetical protein
MKTPPLASVRHPVRTRLGRAIVARDSRKGQLDAAQAAEQRGRELLDAAEAKLAAFGDVDAEIVEFRAAKYRVAATGGAPPNSMALPAPLIAKERARDEARGAVAAAKAAHESLVTDLEQAEKVLRQAEAEVGALAAEILSAEGIEIAAALRVAWSSVWQKMDQLGALTSSWLPDAQGLRPARLPPDVVALMQGVAAFDHRQFPGGRNPSLLKAGANWRRWFAALCTDPDAQLAADAGAPDERRQEVA